MADDKKKKKSLPRAYDEDTAQRTGGKAAEATERAAQRRKEWEAKTKESTERARALTKQMTGYNSQGKTFGTKAGTKEPAFGVDASRAKSTARSGLDALSSASSFEEYAKRRREQDKEQGMKSAAARLAERNAVVNRAALPAEQEIDYAKAAEGLRGESGYGWKRVGNQVVFVTPNSPLPTPTAQNTATPAQAPSLYDIAPDDYVNAMNAVSRKMQGDDSEEGQKAYDDALKLLGDNAPDYVSWRKADYYERYGDVFNADEMAGDQPLKYSGYGTQEGMSLADAKKYTNSPYAAQGGDRYDLQRWSQTTQEERDAYQLMLSVYGQDAADEYMKSLQGELNQRLAGAETQAAAEYAKEHPILGTMKSVATAPVRGAGILEMGVEKAFGKETDLYDPRMNLTREAEAIRGTVAQDLGGVGGFVYQTGMSILDNLANMAVYGGLGSVATTISMGTGSAASAFNAAVDRGASEGQALGAAALSGVAEALFEKVSLDNVIKLAKGGGLKTVLGNIAKQSGIEASEELLTGIANEIGDRLIMGGLSNYEMAVTQYRRSGMTDEEARKQAAWDTAQEIGLGALGGALSGGLMGAGGQAVSALTGATGTTEQAQKPAAAVRPNVPAMPGRTGTTAMDANTQRMLAGAARQYAESQQQTEDAEAMEPLVKQYAAGTDTKTADAMPAPEQEAKTPDVRDELIVKRTESAQAAPRQAETAKPEEEPVQNEKPAEEASEGENAQMLKTEHTATVRDEDGVESQVRVVGVMMDDGVPVMITKNEAGETDYTLVDDLTLDNDQTELLGYEGIKRMDAKGLRNYLDNYDSSKGTAQEYAEAYNTVYQRASAGLDYQQAAVENTDARAYLTEDARMSAYAAGLNAYNQTHETLQPATIETAQDTKAPATAMMSARENKGTGRIGKRYTSAGWNKLDSKGKKNAIAQMELLNAIASRTGRTITIVDSIVGKGGGKANALYDPSTGEIRVALDATGGAYTYAAMHELTHAMKHEHASEWGGFVDFVKSTLKGKRSWNELVKYQMDQFGYTREQAEEEVVCNTVPALLQDESNVLKLYKGNRKLFERVVDWVKGMLKDIKEAGKVLSLRSKSWEQMDALANDRKALQEIYDRMMAVMESQPVTLGDLKNKPKFSMQEAVERKGDLIAAHNLGIANLRNMKDLGGLPSPSIGIVKSKTGHASYGPISLLFHKRSIDPAADVRNRLYGNDAWTPTIGEVQAADNTLKADKYNSFQKRLEELAGSKQIEMVRSRLESLQGDAFSPDWASVPTTNAAAIAKAIANTAEVRLAYVAANKVNVPEFALRSTGMGATADYNKITRYMGATPAVQKWVEGELADAFDKEIIGKDGERIPFTAEGAMKKLRQQEAYGAIPDLDRLHHAAVKKFQSLEQAKADAGRLIDLEDADFMEKGAAALQAYEDLKAATLQKLMQQNADAETIGQAVTNAAKTARTKAEVARILKENGVDADAETIDALNKLFHMSEELPALYFESKPDRMISPDEIQGVVVPKSMEGEVQKLFDEMGINAAMSAYEDGDDADRVRALNDPMMDNLRFSMQEDEAQEKYQGVDLSKDSHVYDYDFLVKLPDIRISTEVPMGNALNDKGYVNHENLKKESLANAAKLGSTENGNVLLKNRYTGRTIRISGHSVDHSTHTESLSKNRVNARASMIAGELAVNAVPLNAEYDTAPNVQGTYVMAAPMRSENGKIESVAALTMEMRTGELKSIETFDALHAVSVRKKNAGALDAQSTSAALTNRDGSTAATRSTYSIAEFLEIVKETHQSMLSKDVLDHFGMERNPQGYYAERVKFSMQEEVEETKDLLAVHNLTEENMRSTLELGGFAMPSIAVIKGEQGHSQYGPISVIFDKNTIDPRASNANKVYGGDAWTPTYPKIERKPNAKVEKKISDKYYGLGSKIGYDAARPLYNYVTDLERQLNNAGGEMAMLEKLYDDTDMMNLYLQDSGREKIAPIEKETVTQIEPEKAEMNQFFIDALGEDVIASYPTPEGESIGAHRRQIVEQNRDKILVAYKQFFMDMYGFSEEEADNVIDNTSKVDLLHILRDAYEYTQNKGVTVKTEVDTQATKNAIREAAADGYKAWVDNLFKGVEEKSGIRNNQDYYTRSGNPRSWDALHWENTLENVVRVMQGQEDTGTGSMSPYNTFQSLAHKRYGSIAEIKADSGRLGKVSEEEYEAMGESFAERFAEIANSIKDPEERNQFIAVDHAAELIVDAVRNRKTKDGMLSYLKKWNKQVTQQTVEKIVSLVNDISNMPTGYFEAKPKRAVGFEEMAAVIVPNNLSDDVRTGLEDAGVNVIEYEAGNEADRLAKMNSDAVNRFKFSLRDTDENVQEATSAEQRAYELVKGHRITAAEADKLAGEMLKLANSDYDQQKAAGRLSRTIDYIERGEDVDWNQVDDELTSLAADVMSKSRTLDLEHEEMAKPIRDYLRTTRIRLTESQRAEAESMAGTYGAYRKNLFGRVRLTSTGGTPLDSLWSELTDMNPELFPADAAEGEMAVLLTNAVDALKPVYHTGMGMNMEESANWLAGKVHEAYLSLPTVKAAAKNAKTFGESIVALKNAMKRFEETSWTEYQNALREIRAARGAQKRTQQQEETEALRKKYMQWREKDTAARKERELKTKYRAKIERTATTLTNWMMKPTDAKHVPAGVEDSVRRMLETLDFSGKSTKTAAALCERLDGLADAIANAQEKEDGNQTMFLERDQQMIDQIKLVAERIRGNTSHQQMEGRGVYDLNGMELKELSKWLDVVRHVVTEASKLRGSNLPGESVEQVAAMSMAEIGRKKAWKDKKWATKKWNELFGPDMQDSFTFFERLGPTTNAIFKGLREGFDKVTQLTRQAEEHTKRILEGVNLKEITGKNAKKRVFNLQSGRIELTRAQIMELYVLSRREQAQGHIYGDGIRIQGDEDVRAHTITKAEVKTITDSLSADEKRVAEGLQRFLSKECASWGNETSMKLLGYRKFGEEHYWPIRTDSNTRNTTRLEDNYAANISAIKNQGMTKATIEGAKNAIVIGDIFDSYTKHISNMAAYSGYALPLSDFTRWYNSRGVKTEIEQVTGQKGLKYINNFLMAVNGSALREEQSGAGKLAGAFSRNAKIASVGANARVVIQQPTSFARAAMYMSPKYLSAALVHKAPKADLINRYCGIAQWKSWGFYETNIGPNLRQMIVGDETAADKLREVAMKPAAMGDQWTMNRLWVACELETKDMYPELAPKSEEYYQQVGKRMSEIIDRTQVVDSVFHRSQMMRSKNAMDQMLTNFMSEPTKTYNMLMSAISDYADNRRNKAARNRVARAFAVYGVTGLMTAAAAAVVDAFRDEDDEKEWLEKYMGAAGSNAADNLNPLGLLPGVKDVLSLLEGYEPSRLDQQSIQRILWAAQEIDKYARGESRQNLYGVTYKTMQALSSVLGIPVSNLMRDANAVYQTVTGNSATLNAEARKNNTANQLFKALESGEVESVKKLREQLATKAGMTPKEIDTALAQRLMNTEQIQQAWNAKSARDYAAMNRIKNALTAKGYGSEVVDKAIALYGNSVTPKEEKQKDPNEQLEVTLYSEEDVVNAARILAGVETGGAITEDDVKAMISERVAGSTAEDPEKSVTSGIQSELKKDYLAMEARGDSNGMRKLASVMTSLLGTTKDTMDGWVKSQHADNLRSAVDKYDSAAASKAVAVMRKDGKTDSEIKSSLSKYKQLYIDAVNARDTKTANKIKSMLKGLGLKGKNGDSLYTDKHFEDWLK